MDRDNAVQPRDGLAADVMEIKGLRLMLILNDIRPSLNGNLTAQYTTSTTFKIKNNKTYHTIPFYHT